ncbi:MAG: SpoIID/LytB domain-containing protein [Deltaproteobacteria bacterium]|nr:SpoIID/LytB domain-containing protein [Deltaproteobacteria bacterium]
MIGSVLALLLAGSVVEDLYGNRLLFGDDGRPLVPVGMMQGQKRVVVRAPGGLVVDVNDKKLEIPGDTPIVIDRKSGVAAVTRELLVIDTLEGDERSNKRARLEHWKKRGLDVKAFDVGGVYGVKGTVVDNRAVIISAAVVPPGLTDVRPVPLEWLDAVPSAVIRVSAPTATEEGAMVRIRARDGGSIIVEKVEHSIGYADHGFEDRLLRDEVLIVPDKRGLLAVVNVVDENDMVAGVLPSEMFATAPLEALKAQAVTARGELFAKIGRRHFADPYLVCSEQHCQVYRGQSAEHPRTNEAARLTAGELAFLQGHVVDSVYSACCGGHTEPAEVVWDRPKKAELVGRPDAPSSSSTLPTWLHPELAAGFFSQKVVRERIESVPAIPAVIANDDDVRAFLDKPRESAWCGRSSLNQKGTAWRWERRFETAALTAAFADLGVGDVVKIAVEERGPGGRLRALRVDGSKGTARVLRELPVRKRLNNLRSGLFVVDEERDETGALIAVSLKGGGFGHGSGMCQQGAIGMAEAGATYKDILGHYYNGAVVKRVF